MDDTFTTDDILTTQFSRIPSELQGLALSPDIRDTVEKFASQRRLTIENARRIEDEIMLVILGLESRSDLETNIKEHVDIEPPHAEEITDILIDSFITPHDRAFRELEEHQRAAEELTEPTLKRGGETEEDLSLLDRDSLLSEIENPINSLEENATERGYEEGTDPYRESPQ